MKTKLLSLLALHLGLAAALAQPVITTQPQNQTNVAGTIATFTVGATGADPLSYQWRSHANAAIFTNIPFGTEATLVLTNVEQTSRRFAVVVNDASGLSVTSSPLVTLTVIVPLSITAQPKNPSPSLGGTARFVVAVTNIHPPIRFQWRLAEINLANQTNSTLSLTNVNFGDVGDYDVVATDSLGSVTSLLARLEIDPTFVKITTGSIVNDGGYGFGCAWGDYNNDGFIDLFVCNSDRCNCVQNDFLYANNGNGTFTRVTDAPMVNAGRWATGAAWGDYDNDGNLDLFVTRPQRVGAAQPNTLYRNSGNQTFTQIMTGSIVTDLMYSHAGIWADFDNDGLLDVAVSNFRPTTSSPAMPNFLYRNNQAGNFDRISFGVKSLTNGDSWNVAAADFNNDGWVDLIFPQGGASTRQNSFLYTNSHNGNFTLQTNNTVVDVGGNSVACAWGDYDNDGFLDLFVSNFYGQNNLLYHNNQDGTFTLVTNSPVTTDSGTSVGCAWGDYDNDGWLDLFVANEGPVEPNSVVSISSESNFLYHNNGDGMFSKIMSGSLVNDLGYSNGCAWGDYDNDGFLDLFVSNGWKTMSENNFLYRNSGNSNNWINLRLIGTLSNRSAIGAKVRVQTRIAGDICWQLREIAGGSGYGSQNDMRANFGLGDATNVDLVRIEWPSGIVQELRDIHPKQFLTITEPPHLVASGTNGEPQFSIKGRRGSDYLVDMSTNLVTWSSLGVVTITNQNGTVRIIETNTLAGNQRFYRAVSR